MQATLAHYSESDIQKSLAAHFREKELAGGFTFFAIPGGSVRVPPHIGKQMKLHGVRAGVPDLVFLLKGPKTVLIELKLPGNYLDANQKEFHRLVTACNHWIYTVKAATPNEAKMHVTRILHDHGYRDPLEAGL
jgi:hypothetical protein